MNRLFSLTTLVGLLCSADFLPAQERVSFEKEIVMIPKWNRPSD